MVEMRIIHLFLTLRNYGIALHKCVVLLQFDNILYQKIFSHIFGHITVYNFPHMNEPVAHLHLSYMALICSIPKSINV